MLQDRRKWIKNSLVRGRTCRTDLLLTPSEMLLTLTGTRLVDWSALLVLVIAGATASGAGEYKIIYDAGKTGCRRLYIHIKLIIMPLKLLRKLLMRLLRDSLPVAFFVTAQRDRGDFRPARAARLLWL